jgi:putative oxidoreductase
MKAIDKLNKWANSKTNIVFDFLRILTGVFFFVKGIQFMQQTDMIMNLIKPLDNGFGLMIISHYVAMSHFAGGLLIAFGLLTRLSCLFQLPIVAGAVLINFTLTMDYSNLIQASVALLMTVFFIIYGSGRHSVDYSMKLHV